MTETLVILSDRPTQPPLDVIGHAISQCEQFQRQYDNLDSADPGFFLELIKELVGHEENHDAKEESVNDDEEGDESRAVVIIAIENVDVWS